MSGTFYRKTECKWFWHNICDIVDMLAGALQELMARMFWKYGSNHIDPPACTIAIGTFIINILFKPEFFNLMNLFK